MILIDNYDSFTYNIVQYLQELGKNPKIYENDKITINDLKTIDFESIIISPGAGNPNTAGVSMEIIKEFWRTKKVLGICLGHQCIGQFFGAKIIKSPSPTHGKTSEILCDKKSKLFQNIPQTFNVTRYHSLEIDKNSMPDCLKISATTQDGVIMTIEHKTLPIYGVQFHPEAILTEYGHELLKNFIDI